MDTTNTDNDSDIMIGVEETVTGLFQVPKINTTFIRLNTAAYLLVLVS